MRNDVAGSIQQRWDSDGGGCCRVGVAPVMGASTFDGYCTCYPDQRGRTADCGMAEHRAHARAATSDLRDHLRNRLLRALFAAGVEVSHIGRVADTLIAVLPELQPCPFCHLPHNQCDCLRSTDE